MKKSAEILGLPIISITEGRELGVSKTLLIDAKNGKVAAITIEDDDWYRGVKLIPYEAIIAIGDDAVTITHSENILKLEEAGDYERLLMDNVRVIGTKAITKSGHIQGKVTEVYIGEGGKIEKCEITAPDGAVNDVTAEQISIFGKQVTVVDVDGEKKNNLIERPAFEAFHEEPAQEVWTPPVEEQPLETFDAPTENVEPVEVVDTPTENVEPVEVVEMPTEYVEPVEEIQPIPELVMPPVEENTTSEETQAALEEVMTPDPVEVPAEPFVPVVEEEEPPAVVEEPPIVEESPVVEEVQPVVEELPVVEEQPVVEEPPVIEEQPQPVVMEQPSEEDRKIAAMTQQAEDLKAALKKARANQKVSSQEPAPTPKQKNKQLDDRRRRVLLGKHATKTIAADSGTIVVEAGAEVTEEVLQRARLSNKFIELSMNVQ